MIKILHSADWHLDAPLTGYSDAQRTFLQQALLSVPGKVASVCKNEGCDLVLLSGDLFDGAYTREGYYAVRNALEEMAVPVVIAPGNHDFLSAASPWLREPFPENVHIFTRNVIDSFAIKELDCRIYGAGYTGMDCDNLLEDFHTEGTERYHIAVLHADPVSAGSTYCPITKRQIEASGLTYLALGHIHKADSLRAGDTLCLWPGCPMGRGYDEEGEKGVTVLTLDGAISHRFLPLNTPRFYDLELEAGDDAAAALDQVLPPAGSDDFYRITLTGPSEKPDLAALCREFDRFPNLVLRDNTLPPLDIWGSAGEDSLEGTYFKLLQQQLEGADEEKRKKILLAAKISRQILSGQEVKLV